MMISNRNIPKSYDDDKSLDNDVGDQVLGGWGLELDTLSFWSFHTRHNLVKQKKIIIIIIITRPTGRQNPLNTEIITFVPDRQTDRQFLLYINHHHHQQVSHLRDNHGENSDGCYNYERKGSSIFHGDPNVKPNSNQNTLLNKTYYQHRRAVLKEELSCMSSQCTKLVNKQLSAE